MEPRPAHYAPDRGVNPVTLDGVFEPDEWYVVFHREQEPSNGWFLLWLASGEFKHVSAFAYCAGFKLWIIYDTELNGTRLRILPHDKATIARLTAYMRGNAVIKIKRNFSPRHFALTSRFGFYCVPAIKHLLGVHCASLWPAGLYRALLRNGGVLLHENVRAKPATVAAGPDAGDGEIPSAKRANG